MLANPSVVKVLAFFSPRPPLRMWRMIDFIQLTYQPVVVLSAK